jgi:hypothetical protein
MDGPVVTAARRALEAGDVDIVLPFVPHDGEDEVRRAFDAAIGMRDQGGAVREIADLHLFETVVRVHRAGEGAPYTGLKPAGLDHGPVIPVAEQAIETGSPEALVGLLADRVEDEVRRRFAYVMELKARANAGVDANRAYVEAMLGLEVWSNRLHQLTQAAAHEPHGVHAD